MTDTSALYGPAQPVADAVRRADDPGYHFPDSGLSDEDALKLVLQCVNRAERRHMQRVLNYLTNYKAYKGILRGTADRWRSRLAPGYAFQILETLYCNLAEDDPRVNVMPMNRGSISGAKCMGKIRNYQRRKDLWAEKLPFFTKQGLIMGCSPMKTAWDQRIVRSKGRRYHVDPMTGMTTEEWYDGPLTLKDQPTFSPLDAADFMPDPSASRLDQAGWLVARYWPSYDQLYEQRQRKTQDGEPVGIYKNVEKLRETRNGAASGRATAMPDDDSIQRDRDGTIEVLEFWTRDHLIVIGNRSVVLRNQEHPYYHRELPFVCFASNPDLYSIQGISEMEVVRDLQTAVWFFLNQRIDNTRLMNNAIILSMNPEADPDMYEFKPGAIWQVDTPTEVDLWTPDHSIVEVSLQAEDALKNDMMNLTSAIPTLAGAYEGSDPQTATQVNMSQALASRRLQTKRGLHNIQIRKAELQSIRLNQQLMSSPLAYRIHRGGDDYDFEELSPSDIALGDFDCDVEDGDESFLRMQQRAEMNEMLSTLEPLLPVLQQMGITANLLPILEKWGSAYGFPDGGDIFNQLPPQLQQALQAQQQMGGGAPGQAPLAGQPGAGSGQPLLPPGGPPQGGNGTAEPQHVLIGPSGNPTPFPNT